jgi:hypothetical protein
MPTNQPPKVRPNNNGRSDVRESRLRPRERTVVTWDEVDNQLLRDTICAVTGAGAAIMLGRTSDGGALSISVLDGDQRIKEWPSTIEEAEKTLQWLVSMFTSD